MGYFLHMLLTCTLYTQGCMCVIICHTSHFRTDSEKIKLSAFK